MEKFYQIQNQWLLTLASYRSEGMDHFFRFLNFFDTNYFYFILIPVIWVGYSWRWGTRLFFFFILAAFLNYFFKELLGQPRPYVYLQGIDLIPLKSYGFPSGGAQNSLILGGLIIKYWKKVEGIVVGISYALLISFSRVYLGVHYFSDLLGGWVLGGILLFLFLRYGKQTEKWFLQKSYFSSVALSLTIPICGIAILPKSKVIFLMVAALGGGIFGLFASYYGWHIKPAKAKREGVARSCIAIAGGIILLLLLEKFIPGKSIQNIIMPLVFSFWLTIGASLSCFFLIRGTTRDMDTKATQRKVDRW